MLDQESYNIYYWSLSHAIHRDDLYFYNGACEYIQFTRDEIIAGIEYWEGGGRFVGGGGGARFGTSEVRS